MSNIREIRLLIVEDDLGHATLVQMNLEEAGFHNKIDHVENGQLAIDYVTAFINQTPNESLLILLDINMPVLDGFQVLERLKSNPRTKHIPVIMLTSTDSEEEIQRAYALGCNVYLRKPVDYEQFMVAIKNLGLFLSVVELPDTANN
ncbi:MAG: response regulator [Chloroflexota bacterium]